MCNFYIDIIIIFCYSKINNIIKLLIKNCKIGKKFGRKAAVKVGNVIYNIKPALRALEKLDKITYGRLNSAILKATGSKTITYWIMIAIEIVAPI